ncbi:hypothetical protein [Alienimonas sp. DA493]|uniref:hypothetical protein n=1 Tax=Alienimonas sp. DA493 TaxID=3373605 RepID=UPI00375504F2
MGEGERIPVAGRFDDPTVQVMPKPTRTLDVRGVRFEFPREFVFEAEVGDSGLAVWTLEGNDVTVMLYAFSVPISAEKLVKEMSVQFGETPVRKTGIKTRRGVLPGVRIDSEVAGQRLRTEGFDLPAPKGEGRVLIVQDVPTDDGRPSADRDRVGRLLATTLRTDF